VDAVEDRQEPVESGRAARVLVVEDEPLVRRVVVRLLVNWGYDPVEAADGPDAVDRFHEQRDRLDLVLLDIMLPRLNGVEVARAIRSEDPTLPILVCSAILDHGVRDQLRGLNVQCCLDKPVRPDLLRTVLTEILRDGDDSSGSDP
jgi:CheY-like chemotaxis protein